MKISMVGIDHSKAELSFRERFSFTKAAAVESMKQIKEECPECGCLLLSTCNRTELWISAASGEEKATPELLCGLKGVSREEAGSVFVCREGTEAMRHLFELACGMKSQIFGEDQIVTQVREALTLARENHCTDSALSRLFQEAVTAAKKVKSQVPLTNADQSSAAGVVRLLKQQFGSLAKLPCMVIGNGAMGRLTAECLVKEGCQVCLTLRQYRYGAAIIPEECSVIPYEDRYRFLPQMKAVISATASPHYTLHLQETAPLVSDGTLRVLADLAVPRDIEPEIGQLPGIVLYDIDQIGGAARNNVSAECLHQAEQILEEAMSDFSNWYYFRDFLPMVQEISQTASDDILGRANKSIRNLCLPQEEQERLERDVYQAANKVLSKLMFGIRDNLNRELWQDCLESLEKSAMK